MTQTKLKMLASTFSRGDSTLAEDYGELLDFFVKVYDKLEIPMLDVASGTQAAEWAVEYIGYYKWKKKKLRRGNGLHKLWIYK